MTTVKIIGMSHTNALRSALRRELAIVNFDIEIIHILREVPDKDFTQGNDIHLRLHSKLHEKISQIQPEESVVFSQVGGNAHNFIGLFEHPDPFDFILPTQENLPLADMAEILPYHYIYKILAKSLEGEFKIFRAMLNSTAAKIFHIESPPPVRDNDFCKENLPAIFTQGKYAKMSVASPVFRYKIWRLHSSIVRSECEILGMQFLPCPANTMDEDGFLLPQFYIDPLHGNDLYGALVLDQISEIIKIKVEGQA